MDSVETRFIPSLSPIPNSTVEVPETSGQSPDDTAALTRRLAVGDEAAFREFHARYFERLYYFLLVMTHGQELEAQEALQDTLLRLARYVRSFPTEEAFWGWLKVVARSVVRDAHRKQHRYLTLLQRVALGWAPAPHPSATNADEPLGRLLDEALGGLEAADRRLVEGKYVQGQTVSELARDSGLTEKAVESRLVRLRRCLREQLLLKLRKP